MAKATDDKATDADIWAGSIEEVKARVKAVLNNHIAAQDNEAEMEESGGDNEAGDACRHAAAVVAKIRYELFGKQS